MTLTTNTTKNEKPEAESFFPEEVQRRQEAVDAGRYPNFIDIEHYNANFDDPALHGDRASVRGGKMAAAELAKLQGKIVSSFGSMLKDYPEDAKGVIEHIQDSKLKDELLERMEQMQHHKNYMKKLANTGKVGEDGKFVRQNAETSPNTTVVAKGESLLEGVADDDSLTVDSVVEPDGKVKISEAVAAHPPVEEVVSNVPEINANDSIAPTEQVREPEVAKMTEVAIDGADAAREQVANVDTVTETVSAPAPIPESANSQDEEPLNSPVETTADKLKNFFDLRKRPNPTSDVFAGLSAREENKK